MIKVQNPILTGFHPDPSICRGRDRYYIATSTFEYFPGLTIAASDDLINWETIARPLDCKRLLDMEGNLTGSGVWAPSLTYHDDMYYLVYSNMKTWANGPFKDCQNFLITSRDIEGPWSDPVYMGSSGFDASLFHDDDGKKYIVNMEWDHRQDKGTPRFSGILVQEIDPKTFARIGEAKKVFRGTSYGFVEGPVIHKVDGYYYLLCAEGETGYGHAESVARSKNIFGPYEVHPQEVLITAADTDAYLQKAGHGNLLQDVDGNWYFAHLCGRPLSKELMRCPLGRETAIQNVCWKDGWPYLVGGGTTPRDFYEVPFGEIKEKPKSITYDIHSKQFDLDFQSLRVPLGEACRKEGNAIVLVGKQSLYSLSKQSLLARRQQHFNFKFSICLDHDPTSFQHMAGLIYRYNEDNMYYLFSSYDESRNCKVLNVATFDKAVVHYHLDEAIPYEGTVELCVEAHGAQAQFSYVTADGVAHPIGEVLDVSILSDDYPTPRGFTGAYVGMCAQDLNSYKHEAKFTNITYTNLDPANG